MVFSSITFLFFFLPIALLLYAISGRSLVLRNSILLVISLLFYTWGGGSYVLILLTSILLNWALGLLVENARNHGNKSLLKLAIIGSVLINLAILCYFKYTNFFINQINGLTDQIPNLGLSIQWPEVILPIGISFYTFQSMSYVVDVAKGSARVMRNPANFALYVSMFPQLLAGPIVRYHEIAEQIEKRKSTWEDVSVGLIRFGHGLVKKVLIADSVARIANTAFENSGNLNSVDAWIGLLAYTVQIYFDFSGYSDMAIGLGRIFGFRFPENFRHPYSSISITDFWRRWHITLSHWFRDYVYIPLGGSRTTPTKMYRNLGIVFLLTGLWHGANWTFIIWGIYHGFWLIVERITHTRRVRTDQNGSTTNQEPRWSTSFTSLRQRSFTLLLIALGWVLFRAQDLTQAKLYYQALFTIPYQGLSEALLNVMTGQSLIALLLGFCIIFFPRDINTGEVIENSSSQWATVLRLLTACITFPLALITVISGSFLPFLYFQF